jgi:uncharacterized membrane protein
MNMKWFLVLVFLLFVGLLVLLYVASEKADPVMLDEQGRPINPPADKQP